MKLYNPLITILLALNIVSCGDSQKDKENYFSFDENNLKPIYQATDKVDLSLLNTKNKIIDSVAYFVNDKRISSVKGNGKFVLDLSGKKLGYQNIKALVYFEGDTISAKTRVEVASGIVPKLLKYTIVNTYNHDVDAFTEGFEFYRHIGLYAYRTKTLSEIIQLKPTQLEKIESLEQLRWLYYGYKIKVVSTTIETPNIDVPADLEKVLNAL